MEGIAIVGMAGRFPGARDLEQFWQNLCDRVETVSFFSEEEVLASGVEREKVNHPFYVRARGVLDDADRFDAAFFGYNFQEAETIDPQERLFLECAWQGLERAGYLPETYEGRIGIYSNVHIDNYLFANTPVDSAIIEEKYQNYLPGSIAHEADLKGSGINAQITCSSSLVAIHLACEALRKGECAIALAGGVSLIIPQQTGYFYQEGGSASPDGHSRILDAQAQGTVSGNGLGVVVLKRLKDALKDGDSIEAIIRATAINNAGVRTSDSPTPGLQEQVEVITQALALADIGPEAVGYIEVNGTGTIQGDAIELAALSRIFAKCKTGSCVLGSVKTNIGHLGAAAGIAGLIKTVLALKHGQLPPSLHFEVPNPQIDFAYSPFSVNTSIRSWPGVATPRRAGISSFDDEGANVHVILEQAPPDMDIDAESGYTSKRHSQLLMLSARSLSALETASTNLAIYLKQHPELDLADVAYTLQVGRKAFEHRRVLVCSDLPMTIQALEQRDPRRVLTARSVRDTRPIAWLFPGQGSQYVGMARELYEQEQIFRQQVDYCVQLIQPLLDLDLHKILYPAQCEKVQATEQLKQTWLIQPVLFIIEYALAQLWKSWGLRPQAMIGHSLGEYVAACLAGVFSLEDALRLLMDRGQLMQKSAQGAMLAVSLSEHDIQSRLGNRLSLAAVNGPSQCVVAGPTEAINTLRNQLNKQGVESLLLDVDVAAHSEMISPILGRIRQVVKTVSLNPPQIPYISNVTGTWVRASEAMDHEYWVQHMYQTVRFAEGLNTLLQKEDIVLLEVGPGQALATFARQHPARTPKQIILPSIRHPYEKTSDVEFLLQTLGKLWLAGVQIHSTELYRNQRRHRLPLPTYPFERQQCRLIHT